MPKDPPHQTHHQQRDAELQRLHERRSKSENMCRRRDRRHEMPKDIPAVVC